MFIEYRETKTFTADQLKDLFLSVGWESGKHPEKLVRGMANSSQVVSAWDGDRLVGLVRALDDGATLAYIHYVLVNPAYQGQKIGEKLMTIMLQKFTDLLYVKVMPTSPDVIPFYRRFGFEIYDNYSAMCIKRV